MKRLMHAKEQAPIRGSLRLQLLSRSLLVLAVLLVFIGLFQYILMRKFTYENKASALASQIMSIPPDIWKDRDTKQTRGLGGSGTDRGKGTPAGNASKTPAVAGTAGGDAGSAPPDDNNGNAAEGTNNPGNAQRGRFFVPDATVVLIGTDKSFTTLSEWTDQATPPRLSDAAYEAVMHEDNHGGKRGSDYHIVKDDQGKEQLVVLKWLGADGRGQGVIQISTGTAELKKSLNSQLLLFGFLALLALFAGLLTLLPVLRKTLAPLSEMVDTVESINAGNLDARFPALQKPIEVGLLSSSFNRMLERLNASFEAEKEAKEHMRQFVADASHELRTPLTSIHGFLEVLLRGASSNPVQLEKALRSMYGESERLKKLVGDLLMLAKLDRTGGVRPKEGNLCETIREMENQLRMLAGTRNVGLILPDGMVCEYDADKIKQVILNLFYNAVQHTDAQEGAIALMVHRTAGTIQLDVRDNGSGIDKAHLQHVFDRFYRSDSSRTRKYGGAGLGLSISKSIVEAHGGTISVESDPGVGTVFMIRLPV